MQILSCGYYVKNASTNESTNDSTSASLDDDSYYIHPHWLIYSDIIDSVPDWVIIFVGVYISVISVIGVLGNICVIAAFVRTPALRTTSNYFIVNLAISDAAFSTTVGFPLISDTCFRRRWFWGERACQSYAFVAGICGFNSIGTMGLIANDRYRFIARPFEMLHKATARRAITEIVGVWLWSALCTAPPLFGWGRYIPEGFQVSCTFDYLTRTPMNIAYNYTLVVVGFLFPVATISCLYIGIVRSAFGKPRTQAVSMLNVHSAISSAKQQKARRKQEIHMAKVLAIQVFLFVISWLPYALIAQLGILGFVDLVTPYSAEIPVLLAKSSAVWNPIVYSLTGWFKNYLNQKRRRQQYNVWSTDPSNARNRDKRVVVFRSSPKADDRTVDKRISGEIIKSYSMDKSISGEIGEENETNIDKGILASLEVASLNLAWFESLIHFIY